MGSPSSHPTDRTAAAAQRRRALLRALAATPLGLSIMVRAQRGRVYRIGMLESVPQTRNAANLDALRRGLRDLGYVEGRNLVIEYRSADGDAGRFPALAAELVRLRVDVIVTRGTPAALAAKNATTTVPVLMATMGDPAGTVASLRRPGGNVTGLTTYSTELIGKRVELLHELVPHMSRVALLHNMANPVAAREWEETRNAARALDLAPELIDVRSEDDISRALTAPSMRGVDGLLVGADGLTQMRGRRIVDLIAALRLPAAYPSREFVEQGGLMAYAIRYPELYLRFAAYIDKILKGAAPAELPIEQPIRFDLVINLKTARALGLEIPPSLLLRADQVIS